MINECKGAGGSKRPEGPIRKKSEIQILKGALTEGIQIYIQRSLFIHLFSKPT